MHIGSTGLTYMYVCAVYLEPVEHLRWTFLEKITKKLNCRCSNGF